MLSTAAALAAGCCLALAVAELAGAAPVPEAVSWLRRRRLVTATPQLTVLRAWQAHPVTVGARQRLELALERAGRSETSQRFLVLWAAGALAPAVALAGAGALSDPLTTGLLGALGLAGGAGAMWMRLLRAGRARRRRLLAELAPTLELMSLELSGGNSPHGAIAAVTARTDGELSRELRRLLAASSVSSAASFETRLATLAERLDLGPLGGLAAVMATSRDYGSGVGQGVRALAVDLRRAQRREVIASSRRALTRVLLPAGVGVMLPFMAILLFPAVSTLAETFR
ncbi:MAG TPA: type II secretion system F family protein [Candidatus Dormibacteraeota bacterium]